MIIESVVSLFGLGFVSASVLSVASKLLAVEEDPRLEVVVEALPGANCGGCGYAGCESYAAAVINDPSTPPNKCCAGGPDVAERLAGTSIAGRDRLTGAVGASTHSLVVP